MNLSLTRQRKRPQNAGVQENVQALSSRIPPVRAVTVTGNLYKPHACLRANFNMVAPRKRKAPVISPRLGAD